MARPNDPNPNPISPFNTPAVGMPQPVPMPAIGANPYGPNPGYNAGGAPPKAKTAPPKAAK